MDVHRQQCQACGSRDVRNILVREEGQAMRVYVRCGGCQALVAQYTLRSYYHHGKGVESFLKSAGPGSEESGRHLLDTFQKARDQAVEGYERALKELQTRGKDL